MHSLDESRPLSQRERRKSPRHPLRVSALVRRLLTAEQRRTRRGKED